MFVRRNNWRSPQHIHLPHRLIPHERIHVVSALFFDGVAAEPVAGGGVVVAVAVVGGETGSGTVSSKNRSLGMKRGQGPFLMFSSHGNSIPPCHEFHASILAGMSTMSSTGPMPDCRCLSKMKISRPLTASSGRLRIAPTCDCWLGAS